MLGVIFQKVNLDLFWLKDEALDDGVDLADPDLIAAEIDEDLRAALEEFELIAADLGNAGGTGEQSVR